MSEDEDEVEREEWLWLTKKEEKEEVKEESGLEYLYKEPSLWQVVGPRPKFLYYC